MRQPVMYISHGGGPCFWIDSSALLGPNAFDELRHFLENFLKDLPEKPKGILMISAHWEEAVPTISTAKAPSMLYDYYGFPEHTYHLQYPAPGAPDIASKAIGLLKNAGIKTVEDNARGFDHGIFVPMLIADPNAEMPIAMMSLQRNLDPKRHIEIGRALVPLRDEGVLIIGSGNSYHSLRAWMRGRSSNVVGDWTRRKEDEASVAFDTWLNERMTTCTPAVRNDSLIHWEKAPSARACHPREEHLMPLMVASGAAGEDMGRTMLRTSIGGKAVSCFSFG